LLFYRSRKTRTNREGVRDGAPQERKKTERPQRRTGTEGGCPTMIRDGRGGTIIRPEEPVSGLTGAERVGKCKGKLCAVLIKAASERKS